MVSRWVEESEAAACALEPGQIASAIMAQQHNSVLQLDEAEAADLPPEEAANFR